MRGSTPGSGRRTAAPSRTERNSGSSSICRVGEVQSSVYSFLQRSCRSAVGARGSVATDAPVRLQRRVMQARRRCSNSSSLPNEVAFRARRAPPPFTDARRQDARSNERDDDAGQPDDAGDDGPDELAKELCCEPVSALVERRSAQPRTVMLGDDCGCHRNDHADQKCDAEYLASLRRRSDRHHGKPDAVADEKEQQTKSVIERSS